MLGGSGKWRSCCSEKDQWALACLAPSRRLLHFLQQVLSQMQKREVKACFLFFGSITSLQVFCFCSNPVPCLCLQAAELPVRARRTKAVQQMKGKAGQLRAKENRGSCLLRWHCHTKIQGISTFILS